MRTFARCLPTIKWHVLRHFQPEQLGSSIDFFVSTVRDGDAPSAELLRREFPQSRVEIDLVDAQPELPIPLPPHADDWTLGRMYGHEPYAISVHPQAILRQLWQLNRCWEFFTRRVGEIQREEKRVGIVPEYDLIIRLRPDSWFRSFAPPSGLNEEWSMLRALTPWWGRFGGINDRFALLGLEAARAYFTTYAQLPDLLASGCPLHPESLIRASLERNHCDVHDTLLVEFSKLYGPENPALEGTFRDPEITLIDQAHVAAKRGVVSHKH